MKRSCLLIAFVCILFFIYGLCIDKPTLVTGGLILAGCMFGNYIGLTVKERMAKGKTIEKIESWTFAFVIACIFAELVVILSHFSPIESFRCFELSDAVIIVLCFSAFIMSGAVLAFRYIINRNRKDK